MVGKVVTGAKKKLTDSFRPLPTITDLVGDALRPRQEFLAENMMLRRQLIVASRKIKQPRFRPQERGLPMSLSSIVRHWREAVLLVKPDTILRWHREGFRLLWSRKSKSGRGSWSPLTKETIELIAPCAPRMNSVCERCLGGARRECLDHVITLGEDHLRSVLSEHVGG